MRKECKRHDWRIGAKLARVVNMKIAPFYQVVFCFKCNKKIYAKLK